jgi:hypothetical protein
MVEFFGVDGVWNGEFHTPLETAGLDYASARDCTPRYWLVSYGNGNDGVSRYYPPIAVRTCDPWELARLALLYEWQPIVRQEVDDAMGVDGDAEYGIYATLYEEPGSKEPPECQCDASDDDDADHDRYCPLSDDYEGESGPAEMIVEVFLWDGAVAHATLDGGYDPVDYGDAISSDPRCHDSLAAAFGAKLIAEYGT